MKSVERQIFRQTDVAVPGAAPLLWLRIQLMSRSKILSAVFLGWINSPNSNDLVSYMLFFQVIEKKSITEVKTQIVLSIYWTNLNCTPRLPQS